MLLLAIALYCYIGSSLGMSSVLFDNKLVFFFHQILFLAVEIEVEMQVLFGCTRHTFSAVFQLRDTREFEYFYEVDFWVGEGGWSHEGIRNEIGRLNQMCIRIM